MGAARGNALLLPHGSLMMRWTPSRDGYARSRKPSTDHQACYQNQQANDARDGEGKHNNNNRKNGPDGSLFSSTKKGTRQMYKYIYKITRGEIFFPSSSLLYNKYTISIKRRLKRDYRSQPSLKSTAMFSLLFLVFFLSEE